MTYALDEVSRFSNAELVSQVKRLVREDRALSAKLLVHLGEVDARRLFLELGYSSMFEYCRSGLGMSEAEASLRITAARAGRKFPLIVERLGAAAVHLSAIKLLAPHLTEENHAQLLDRVRGMTKRQVEVLVADLAPKPDVPTRVRKLPEPQAVTAPSAPATAMFTTIAAPADAPSFSLESPRARATSTPLGRGRFKVQLMLGQEAHTALEQLAELFRHQNPSGDYTTIVERALCELLKSTMKRRFGQTNARPVTRAPAPAASTKVEATVQSRETERKNPSDTEREKKHPPKSRYIGRATLREIHARDEGQCTYVSPEGRRCTERGFLEVHHHTTTFARGGEATAENLRITCRAHNLYFAERDYGRAYMQAKLRNAAAQKQLSLVPERVQT